MRTYLMLGAATLALAACKLDRSASTAAPQFAAAAPFDLGLAPGYDALPAAQQPIPIAYAPQPVAQNYWNDAQSMGQAYYDQPPSYFPYYGATPLVWNQGDTISRIVEALVGGGQREYYYQPGAAYPYFVRDPQYAYGYDDGQLISVYDPSGQPLPLTVVQERAPMAAAYLTRAQTLYDVARRTNTRQLTPKVWTVERERLVQKVDNPAWKTWWTPGENRSPVAVQRLAEVRQRKLERDLAHDEWKARAVKIRADQQQVRFAERGPQFRAEAAPPGQRVHAILPPVVRQMDVKRAEVRAPEPREVQIRQAQARSQAVRQQTKRVEVRQVQARKEAARAQIRKVEVRRVERQPAAAIRKVQARAIKAEHAPAAAEHARAAAFKGKAPAKRPAEHGKKDR